MKPFLISRHPLGRVLLSLAAILFLAIPLPGAARTVLTLDEFLGASVECNPEIFRELARIRESEAAELQTKAIHDIVFNIHYNKLYEKPFSRYTALDVDRQDSDNAGAGLQWAVPGLGTRLRAGFEYTRRHLLLGDSAFNAFLAGNRQAVTIYNPEIYIELQQPLLKNWLGIVDEFPIRQAKLNRLIMRETVDEGIETILADLYGLYLNWYHAHRQLEILEKNAANGEALVRTVSAKHRTGLSDTTDVARARITSIEAQKARDSAAVRLRNLTRKVYVWKSGDLNPPDNPDIVPQESIELRFKRPQGFSVHTCRQMKILDITREALELKLRKERNELLPELNLTLSARARDYAERPGIVIEGFTYPAYAAGLSLSYPLSNSLARGRIEETRALLKKWEEDVRQFERSYAQSIEELEKTSALYETILARDDELVEQARIRLREEERKYLQGRSELYLVITDRNELLGYELVRFGDYVDSKRVLIQLMGLMDAIKKR